MSEMSGRDAELLGAAAAGELTREERLELYSRCAADPVLRAELDALVEVSERVAGIGGWVDVDPPADLEQEVVGADRADHAAAPARSRSAVTPITRAPTSAGGRRAGPRRRIGLAAAAVALVAVGSGGTLAVQSVADQPPSGPPGTLGAVEPVAFAPDEDAADVDASLVAHTWGTEAVLRVEGLPAEESFDVFFVDEDGTEVNAGAFLGSRVTIDCRLNAAVLREDVRELRIQRADGTVVRQAEVPTVTG